jgi:hypothetical protein
MAASLLFTALLPKISINIINFLLTPVNTHAEIPCTHRISLLLFTGSVMIVFLGFYYFPDTIPGIVLQPPKKGAFSTKKYWYLYK